MLTDVVAAFVYDLEAGRPDARERAETRLTELRNRFAGSLRNIAAQDSTRAARQLQPPGRPLSDFTGSFEEPSFGTIKISMKNARLEYRWGALYGPAEIYDGPKSQLRIEMAGSGNVLTFFFDGPGAARSVELNGTKFVRTR